MVKFTEQKLILFVLTFSLFAIHCASQIPPSGGDVDTIPPKIIKVYPSNGTTNYQKNYFELTFSEYVDKRTVKDAIFISPSIEGSLELDWSGKSVKVKFPEDLKKDITYNITIGTDVADYNNKNRMAEAYNFTFSTGSKIDNRIIEGNIYSGVPSDVMILAYKSNSDTINPSIKKPDYISQAGTDGKYKLIGLAEGNYIVYAIKDEFRDLLYQEGQDSIGIPFKIINLAPDDTLFKGLNFSLTKFDTTKPRIVSANMTDNYHILMNFSKEIDTVNFSVDNFYLFDSTDLKPLSLSYLFKGKSKNTEWFLTTKEETLSEHNISLIVKNFSDFFGNINEEDFIQITTTNKVDTTAPKLYKTIPEPQSNTIDFQNPEFYFYFDDGFDFEKILPSIKFTDTLNRPINFQSKKIDDASFIIETKEKLKSDNYYLIKFDLNLAIDAAGNKIDSVYQYKFKTITGLEFTGVSGKVKNLDTTKNAVLILSNAEKNSKSYQQKIKQNGIFEFERVEPGKYFLICFYDDNKDGKFNYGIPFPLEFSEQIIYFNEILNLPPRWSVTDVLFDLNE